MPERSKSSSKGGDFFQFPNTEGHPPDHRRFIGRIESGTYVTAILKEPDERRSVPSARGDRLALGIV